MVDVEIRDTGEAIVAALSHGGVDHLFFCSGTELGFYQERSPRRTRSAGRRPG